MTVSAIEPSALSKSPLTEHLATSLKVLAGVGLALIVFGGLAVPNRLWASLLILGYYIFGVGIGAMYFLATYHAAGGGWSAVFKRVPESLLHLVPVGGVVIAAALLGDLAHSAFAADAERLYPWMMAEEGGHGAASVQSFKDFWLQPAFFYVRSFVVLLVVSLFARALRVTSLDQDMDGSSKHTVKTRRLSVLFLIFGSVLLSIGSVDWFMSLEPMWYSTMYIVYHFAGNFVTGLAVIVLMVLGLRKLGLIPGFTRHHLHDMGKLVFAISTFWMYIWFSQFMLIWYTNFPEETMYFTQRLGPGRTPFLVALPIIMWVIPFVTLLSQRAKRSPTVMGRICVVILLGHWLDLFEMIGGPGVHGGFSVAEVGAGLAAIALVILLPAQRLTRGTLIPDGDPYLEESRHHHV